MRTSLVALFLCVSLGAGCGDSAESDRKLDKLGADLKNAGEKAGEGAEDLGEKMAEGGKELSAAASEQLERASEVLARLAADTGATVSMKGDELSSWLKARMEDTEDAVDSVKAQLRTRGDGEWADRLAAKRESLGKALDNLAASGAAAGNAMKQAAIDAFDALRNELQSAVTRLKS